MSTVAIVGAGEIGGAAAFALAAAGHAGRIVMIDDAANAAAGKALDILQAGAIVAFHARLEGTQDTTRAAACDVCVVADDFGGHSEPHAGAAMLRVRQLAGYISDAPIVFAGAAHDDLLARSVMELRLPRKRIMGSAPQAFASAISAIVAMEAECSPSDVMLTVLGTAPAGFVVPWSEASIGGYALQQVLPQVTLARIDRRAKALWPPGPYALGTAAAQVVNALLSSSRRFLSVTTQLEGEFGVSHRPGIVSARLGRGGIQRIRLPELTTRERVLVQGALGA